jgi:hypothetical protein
LDLKKKSRTRNFQPYSNTVSKLNILGTNESLENLEKEDSKIILNIKKKLQKETIYPGSKQQ